MKPFKQILDEMPQMVNPTQFKLNDDAFNQNHLKRKKVIIDSSDDYDIIKTGNNNNRSIILYDKNNMLIDYWVRFKRFGFKSIGGSFITQTQIWRRDGSPWVQGITRKMFFDYLLKHNKAIMSDSMQTVDGKRFWIDRMAEATSRGLYIGLANLNLKQIEWFEGNSSNYRNWIKSKDSAWGEAEGKQALRFVIANRR